MGSRGYNRNLGLPPNEPEVLPIRRFYTQFSKVVGTHSPLLGNNQIIWSWNLKKIKKDPFLGLTIFIGIIYTRK